MFKKNAQRRNRNGFTLIELLVSVSIATILLSLLIVGVQHAREAARRLSCQSRMRQLGIALAGYDSQYGVMPSALAPTGSVHVAILPYVEETAVYKEVMRVAPDGRAEMRKEAVKLPLLMCPSDGVPSPFRNNGIFGTNYAASIGVWAPRNGFDGAFRPLKKPFDGWRYGDGPLRLSDFTDGTSHTACFSEILRSDDSRHRLRVVWQGPRSDDLAEFTEGCLAVMPGDPLSCDTCRGTPWTDGNVGYTLYNHAVTPNNPSCNQGTHLITAASTTSSGHASGVNVLYADGHVSFESESIDARVWRAIGSRESV